MASFALTCDVEDKNSATGWETTPYKCLAAWIDGTGATGEPIQSGSRPGLARSC